MKIRFFAGSAFMVLFFIAMIWLTGNPLAVYTDPVSFLVGIIFPHVLISFFISLSDQRRMIHETLSGEGDIDTLRKALLYFKSLRRMILCCTVATVILGTIGIMVNLEDTASVGPNLAVCLIVTFYAALYILAVIEPLRLAAELKLSQEK